MRGVDISMKGTISIDPERCKGCCLCIEFCPKQAISISDRLNMKGYFVAAFIDGKECTGCGTCAVMCPDVAIEVMKT
jgi:2-oxoglutarate ferredoxin oxidoreductase subunit delta